MSDIKNKPPKLLEALGGVNDIHFMSVAIMTTEVMASTIAATCALFGVDPSIIQFAMTMATGNMQITVVTSPTLPPWVNAFT